MTVLVRLAILLAGERLETSEQGGHSAVVGSIM